jgi:ferredoxin
MKATVDLNVCTGHARCQVKCPEVYGTDDVLGKCVILLSDIPKELEAGAVLGAKSCPERAIKIIRD